jgi:molecular chaperone GrpE
MTEHERPANGELGPPAAEAGTTMESLQGDVARLKQEVEHNWQQFLRAAADLENYRKQAARQREDAVGATRRSMLMIILSVVDTLERAIEHTSGASPAGGGAAATAIADGIRLAHRQVLDRLATVGVRPMETAGQPFDPRVHEAVEAIPATGTMAVGTVAGEVQRGYLLGEEVLRPARVRVAQ